MYVKKAKAVILQSNHQLIKNIYALNKIGAGHDGIVYRYENKALKLLKHDIITRKNNGLMTYEKVIFFQDKLDLKRILKPIDIMLDADGIYVGYVMNYCNRIYTIDDFYLYDLLNSVSYLEDDFQNLTKNNILAKDINRNSYIISEVFLHLCDIDKYNKYDEIDLMNKNYTTFNFAIAKYLYLEMKESGNLNKEELKKLIKWVKLKTNEKNIIKEIEQDYVCDNSIEMKEYILRKRKQSLN